MAKFNMEELFGSMGDDLTIDVENDVLENNADVEDSGSDDDPIEESEDIEIEDSEKEDVVIPSPDNTDLNKENNSSFYLPLAKVLEERGYFEIKDKKIESLDDLDELLDEALEKRRYVDLTDTQKEYLQALRNGIPEQVITNHLNYMDSIESITDEDLEEETDEGIELRKGLLMQSYKLKGFTEGKAEKIINKFFDSGEDVTEAKEARIELKTLKEESYEKEKAKYAELADQRKQKEKENLKILETYASTVKEIIPGNPVSKKMSNEIYKGLITPVSEVKYLDQQGKEQSRGLDIVEDFLYNEGVEGRFKLAYLLKLTEGLKKLDILSAKKTKTKVQEELERSIQTTDFKKQQNFTLKDLKILDTLVDVSTD